MNTTQKAKQGNKQEIKTEDAANVFNDVVTTGQSAISESEAFAHLETIPDAAFQEQTGEYFSFEKAGAGTYNFIFDGLTELTLNGKKQKAVRLRDKNNQAFVCASAVLVSTCEKLTTVPSFIRVIFDGEMVKTTNGEYAKLRVLTLPGQKN